MKDNERKSAVQRVSNADSFAARQLQKGLTLVPCLYYTPDGRRQAGSVWVRLLPGETLSRAAHRLRRGLV